MTLLVLISFAQLLVSLVILAVLVEAAGQRESERLAAERTIRGLQQQAIRGLFTAAADARADVIEGRPDHPAR